ncbi:MAG: DUF5684 domain-containing protein [Actinobacteria bacterium]|nr:DUF5684 domain-containing protein [Actinomycetota bacterium]
MGVTEITIYGIVSFIGYIIVGIRLMKLCEASSVGSGWFAFVPILNFTRWARLAGKNPWLVLLFFIPVVGVVLELLWINKISEHTGTKSPWFWVFLIFTLGGWGVASIFSGVMLYIALLVVAVLMIASQWMIFDPTKPIAGVADNS